MLGNLLNSVKWSTFCVSFVRVFITLGWLQCYEIFKIDYLVTSNVRFGTVSINPVTYATGFMETVPNCTLEVMK